MHTDLNDRTKSGENTNGNEAEGDAMVDSEVVPNGTTINESNEAEAHVEDEEQLPPMKRQKVKFEKSEKKTSRSTNGHRTNDVNIKNCATTNPSTYRYPDFCGVLGKKIKRMNAILNERSSDKP